jgi:citrate lyase subunit beta/citryl-CoA lyase
LFIPANNAGFVAKAHTRGADAVILDLEDSVAPAQKASARAGLAAAAAQVAAQGTAVLVRVNADSLSADLIAAVNSAVSAIVLPKVAAAAAVLQAAAQLEVLEHLRGLAPGQIGLIAQIEDVAALPRLDDIAAASPRLWGMSLGSEDFSASAGMQPTAEALYGPNQQVVLACRRAGIRALGFPASIALFGDLAALATAVNRGAQMGFTGALCIHPAQVAVLNQAFTPDPDAVADARQLLAAFADASAAQCGVLAWHGKMVDLPVILRARDLVARAEALAASAVNRITAPPPENVPEP